MNRSVYASKIKWCNFIVEHMKDEHKVVREKIVKARKRQNNNIHGALPLTRHHIKKKNVPGKAGGGRKQRELCQDGQARAPCVAVLRAVPARAKAVYVQMVSTKSLFIFLARDDVGFQLPFAQRRPLWLHRVYRERSAADGPCAPPLPRVHELKEPARGKVQSDHCRHCTHRGDMQVPACYCAFCLLCL